MRSRRVTAIATSMLVLSGGLTAFHEVTAHATEPGADGLLATSANGGIRIGSPDTAATAQAATIPSGAGTGWSSDGSQVAYTNIAGTAGLFTADADGSNAHRVTQGWSMPVHPTWFNGDTKLVYQDLSPTSGHSQLYILPLGAGDTAQGSPLLGSADTGYCDGSPNAHGNQIIFTRSACDSSAPDQLWIYDKTTGAAHLLLANASDGDISPDGTKIVFRRLDSASGYQSDLFEANIDGSNVTQLTTSGATTGLTKNQEPVWSPSGTRIAFYDGTNTDILDLATMTQTTWYAGSWGAPAWQPVDPAPTAQLKASVGGLDAATGETDVTLDATGSSAGAGFTYSFDFGDGQNPTTSSSPTMTVPEPEGTYKVTVTVTNQYGKATTSTPQWLTVGDGYHPVAPTRLLDTRIGLGAPAGKTRAVKLQLPDSVLNNSDGPVTAVALNVTVTDTTSSGNVKVYPHGVPQVPTTSNLNFTPGLTVANLVTVPVIDGKVQIDVTSTAPLSLVADISGYYTAGSSGAGFAPVTPTRLMDTRNGDLGGRVNAWGEVSLPVPASVPSGATAVVLNATAVNTAAAGDLDVFPDVPGQAKPVISNLNFGPGATVPNLVVVPISADRKIDFYLHSSGSADLLADIQGYFSPAATSKFVPWYPTRLLDTRNGDAGGTLDSGWAIDVPIGQIFQVPNSALTAGLYNVTVTEPVGPGHITVYPDGLSQPPTVSNLNYSAGQTVPNAVLTNAVGGTDDFYNFGSSTQLIVDFFGYFAEPLSTEAPVGSAAGTAKTNTAGSGSGAGSLAGMAGSKALTPADKLSLTARAAF